MDYFEIIKRAAIMTWKHKALWLFGFLFTISSGGSQFRSSYQSSSDQISPQIERVSHQLSQVEIAVIVAIVLFVIVLGLIMIFVNFLSQAAMIGMVKDAEETGQTSVRSGFKHGWSKWAPVLGISFLIFAPFILVVLVLLGLLITPGILALVAKNVVLGVVLLVIGILLSLVIIIPTAIGLGLVNHLADRYCVLEGKGVRESIVQGWRLLRANVGKVLLMWLVMMLVGIVIGLVTLVFGIGLVLSVVGTTVAAIAKSWAVFALALPFALVFLLIFLFIMAVVSVFTFTAWTLFFMDLRKVQEEPTVA